jgi:hypothetical protein
MMMTCHVNKDLDNNVGGQDVDSHEEYNDDGHSRYLGLTQVQYPVVLLRLKDIDNNVKSDVDSNDGSNEE